MMQKITQLEDDIVMINSFHKKFVFVIYDDQNNTYKHTYIYIYIYIYIYFFKLLVCLSCSSQWKKSATKFVLTNFIFENLYNSI